MANLLGLKVWTKT